MPTLFRFVVTLCVLSAIVYGAMFALATLVKPRVSEISVDVPLRDFRGSTAGQGQP